MQNSLVGFIRISIVLLCSSAFNSAWPFADALERPAMNSKRAEKSLLLGVSRESGMLVAVGERGIVLLSEDEGRTWMQAQVPVSVTLTSVSFVGKGDGWVTGHGGVLLHTADGGKTWKKIFDGVDVAKLIFDAEVAKNGTEPTPSFVEAQRLVADGADKPLLDIRFQTPSTGFLVGAYGVFLRTQDGGKTWSPRQASLPNLQGRHLYKIEFVKDHIYIVGEQGAAYLSSDGGETFKELKSPYRGSFFGAVASHNNDIIIYGLRGNAYRVSRQGSEWVKIDALAPSSFTASKRLSSGSTIIATQNGNLLRSIEGGKSFIPMQLQDRYLISALEETTDGALIIVGRGISRVVISDNLEARK